MSECRLSYLKIVPPVLYICHLSPFYYLQKLNTIKKGGKVLLFAGKCLYLQPVPKNHDNDNNYHQIKENKRLSLWCLGRLCPDADVNVCVLWLADTLRTGRRRLVQAFVPPKYLVGKRVASRYFVLSRSHIVTTGWIVPWDLRIADPLS